ncbi:MAG: hypothetical protein PUC59_10765 [Firmicutes bacterium]|nr:hypothetical protein [Bacillota bacterium]
MKRQKCFGVLSLVIGIVMLLGCGARVLLAEQKNKPVIEAFQPHTTVAKWQETIRQLENKTPLEQIDLFLFTNFGPQDRMTVSMGSHRLRTTLRYYAHPGDLFPVLTLKAGTMAYPTARIDETEPDSSRWIYYGVHYSFPSYRSGWRYTRAYLPEEDEGEAQFYYVRTEDLKRELLAGIEESMERIQLSEEEREAYIEKTVQEFFILDHKFYTRGIYLSPDLLEPLWDGWNTALFAVGIAFCLAGLALLFCAGRRDGQTGG